MLPPGISEFFLHMALRCEQCLTCCFTVDVRVTIFFLSSFALGITAEIYLDVVQESGGGALCTRTVTLKAAGFVSIAASLLAN